MVIFFPSIHPSLPALAGTPPRGPRYQKQCLYPGNLCGRFFLAAAPEPQPQNERDNESESPSHFRFWILRRCSAQVLDFDCRNKNSEIASEILCHCFSASIQNLKSTNPKCHLMTLSARASTFGGIVRPICFAVFKLMTSSNFVGCSTGRSAGLAPFRILVHVICDAPVAVREVRPVVHEPAGLYSFSVGDTSTVTGSLTQSPRSVFG